MTLIIEDGTGVSGANTYASVASVDSYCSDHGYSDWSGTDAVKEAAILRAMIFLESQQWKGIKAFRDNPLEWPRSYVTDKNGYAVNANIVHPQVVKALCEAAYRELQTPGCLLQDIKREDVLESLNVAGAVVVSFSASAPITTDYRLIKSLLQGLIVAGGGVRLVR